MGMLVNDHISRGIPTSQKIGPQRRNVGPNKKARDSHSHALHTLLQTPGLS